MQILNILSRYGLILFGLANWLLGSILLVYVLWTLNTASNFHLIVNGRGLVTISQLIFGLIIAIKGLLAIFGAIRRQTLLLKWFVFLSVMSISLEIGTFISLKVTNVKLSDVIVQGWEETNLSTRNYIQRELQCCGLTGLAEFASKLDPIDESCYRSSLDPQNREPYRVGCKEKLIDWLGQRQRKKSIILSAVFLLCQLLSLILGLLQLRCLLRPVSLKRSNSLFQESMLLTPRIQH